MYSFLFKFSFMNNNPAKAQFDVPVADSSFTSYKGAKFLHIIFSPVKVNRCVPTTLYFLLILVISSKLGLNLCNISSFLIGTKMSFSPVETIEIGCSLLIQSKSKQFLVP